MEGSWDEDSNREYEAWIETQASEQEKHTCLEHFLMLKHDILKDGPIAAGFPVLRTAKNKSGDEVTIHGYSLLGIEMIIGFLFPKHVHLVFLGPKSLHLDFDEIVNTRISRW